MRTSAVKDLKQQLSLYFVAGTMNCGSPEAFERILLQTIQGGITAFQFREKGAKSLRGEQRLEVANRAKMICREHGVLFIVNDDLELMKSVDADGLHVGQKDGDLKTIREETKGKILGVSAHTFAEAEDAVSKGADYIGVGPIYQTASKEDAEKPVGVERIKELLMNHINLPLVGIGGITIKNVNEVILAGADGVAVISALSGVDYPEEASRKMVGMIQSAKRGA